MTLGQYLREYLADVFTIAGAELIPPGVGEPKSYPAYSVDLNYKAIGDTGSVDGQAVREVLQHYSARGWVEVALDTAGSGTLDAAMDTLEQTMMLAIDAANAAGNYDFEGFSVSLEAITWQNIFRAPDDVNGKGSITIDGILTYYYVVE